MQAGILLIYRYLESLLGFNNDLGGLAAKQKVVNVVNASRERDSSNL